MVCSLRVTRTGTSSHFARVHFFVVCVISSTPMPSSRLGTTDKYDGDAQMRKSSVGALQHGAALRLVPFARSFCCVVEDRFCIFSPYSCPVARGAARPSEIIVPLLRCLPLVRPFSHSLLAVSRGISSPPCRDGNRAGERRDACRPQYHSHQTAASVGVPHDFCRFSTLCADPTPEKFFEPVQIVSSIVATAKSTT